MKIKKLSAKVRSKLQSGLIITDAVQCVLELVHNSLDAEATGIAVQIDLKAYRIRVIDNGRGIEKDDLEFVGERFMTSKYHSFANMETSFSTYGFRGQALSSLQEVSKSLKIETKSKNNGPTFVKVFQNNKALPITEMHIGKSGTGTTISVEDFLCAMPVRRKRVDEVFDLEEIKSQLQYLALIHYNVCFTLRNENKNLILLQTSPASTFLESVVNIYGKALAKSLEALSYEEKKYKLSGFISLKPQTQNNIQLVFINKRIITKGVIHKFVNNLLKKYFRKKNLFTFSPTGKILKSLKSSHNAFIMQIKCPHFYYELLTNIRKTAVEFKNWKDVLRCIRKAVEKTTEYVSNSDSALNTHDKNNKMPLDEENRKAFGTSLLMNAVKGVPAKRNFKNKRYGTKNYETKVNKNKEKFDILLSQKDKNKVDDFSTSCINTDIYQKEFTNDTLESPIPKHTLKLKKNCGSELKKTETFNQLFVEFFEWFKAKFEIDTQALKDFLHLKIKTSHPKDIKEFKSPVLGGKLKRKQGTSIRKEIEEKKRKKLPKDFSAMNEEMPIMSQRQLKILPERRLRVKRAVRLSRERDSYFSNSLDSDLVTGDNLNFEKPSAQSVMKKCESIAASGSNQAYGKCNHTVASLPSSEIQFTNLIKFRNLSESFFHRSYGTPKEIPTEKILDSFVSNTWVPQYGSQSLKFCEKTQRIENSYSRLKAHETEISNRDKNLRNFDVYNFSETSVGVVKLTNKRKKASTVQDVEIQVNISDIVLSVQKVDAVVQTHQAVPETPSFENSFSFDEENGAADVVKAATNLKEYQSSEGNFKPEVPNPDFWNTSIYMQANEINNPEFVADTNELIVENPKNGGVNESNTVLGEFICGHKSHLSTKPQYEKSISKETQTLVAIWPDSLTKIGYSTQNINADNIIRPSLTNAKSENTQLPKTLSLDDVESHISKAIESGFCLTERHNFIPKGLSPEILNPDTIKMPSLTPREKYNIKSTIDSIQNDLLTTIKWRDASTGDCLKPTIPDEILFSMRRNADKCATDYENPVLSASLSYCAVKVHNLLHSFAFTKELLSGVKIIGQLDKKFMVTKMKISAPKKMELITLFDQHAVDERIKLEELINENVTSDGKLVSSRVNPPVESVLTESEVRIFFNLKEKLSSFGLSAKPINKNTVSVNEIPTFLLYKHEKDLKNKKETSLSDTVKALIVNMIEELTETKGAVSKIPKIIHNLLCSEACHKAIKFNKTLTIKNMTDMINKLKNCKLPFQCAHGRPSVIPIIDIEDFNSTMEEDESIGLEKLKKFFCERKDCTTECPIQRG